MSATTHDPDAIVRLGQLALDFGRINRSTYHQDGVTPESDTDHTVMLGLLACALAAKERLDVGLVAQYALVHDLVEVYAGDVCTLRLPTAEAKAAKAAREQAAYDRIRHEYADTLPWLPDTIAAYEARADREARYVKALDKLLPKITHLSNGYVTWREAGVTHAELADRYEVQAVELRSYAADFPALLELHAVLVRQALDGFAALQGVAA